MNILAIDPGMSGAVVSLGSEEIHVVRDFKHIEDLTRSIDKLSPECDVAVLELVASRPGQGVASLFEFGRVTGVALGALHSNGFSTVSNQRKKLVEVTPFKWQKYFRVLRGDVVQCDSRGRMEWPEFNSAAMVKQFYPRASHFLTRVKDHNTADAILMALWYLCTAPECGSFRKRDRDRLPWLRERFSDKPDQV